MIFFQKKCQTFLIKNHCFFGRNWIFVPCEYVWKMKVKLKYVKQREFEFHWHLSFFFHFDTFCVLLVKKHEGAWKMSNHFSHKSNKGFKLLNFKRRVVKDWICVNDYSCYQCIWWQFIGNEKYECCKLFVSILRVLCWKLILQLLNMLHV